MQFDNDTLIRRHPAFFHRLFAMAPSPPKEIWIEGREESLTLLDRLPDDGLAIVGTRAPERRALFHLVETVRRLRGSRLIVLSGLARGIDSAAHEAALAAGLPTIAFLGCGIRRTYPPENVRLRQRIVDAGGLILSEFPPDAEARPPFFIQRNRLIAAYAAATWIVQSGYRSGALNTARRALDMEKKVFATPSFPGDPAFMGNETLFVRNADIVKALWGAEDLTYAWADLFGVIQKNRRPTQSEAGLDIVVEVEKGIREGKDVFSILEERSRRTGESVDALLARMEKTL